MKKNLSKSIFALVFAGVAAYGGVKAYNGFIANDSNSLMAQNIEALASDESTDGEEDKTDQQRKQDCLNSGGIWNRCTTTTKTGFESATCKISGEISMFGVTLKGSYEKGKSYSIAWAEYNCSESNGNCCTKQGLYTGDKKLA